MNPWGFPGGNVGGGNPWGPPIGGGFPGGNVGGSNPWGAPPGGRNPWDAGTGGGQPPRPVNDAGTIVDKAKTLFNDDPRFEFEGLLGGFHNGTAMRFKEKSSGQRFIAKAGTGDTVGAINNEISYLNLLRFAMHIVKPIAIDSNPLVNLGVPYYVTGYLQNGTLKNFIKRIQEAGERLPNRLLWRLFLCMVRTCVELAWPPQASVQLGQIGAELPSRLAHNDFHNENLMFGGLDKNTPEHALVPILQLIDFGESQDILGSPAQNEFQVTNHDERLKLDQYRRPAESRNEGTDKNVYDVGILMGLTIRQRDFGFPSDIRTWMRNPNLIQQVEGQGDLDPVLRLLVQRCIAENPLNRPRLEELLTAVSNAVVSKTAQDYPKCEDFESDSRIESLVKRYIFDANVEPPVADANAGGGGGGNGGASGGGSGGGGGGGGDDINPGDLAVDLGFLDF